MPAGAIADDGEGELGLVVGKSSRLTGLTASVLNTKLTPVQRPAETAAAPPTARTATTRSSSERDDMDASPRESASSYGQMWRIATKRRPEIGRTSSVPTRECVEPSPHGISEA